MELRTERKNIIDQEIKKKKYDRTATQQLILAMNEAYEQKLCGLLGKNDACQETIAQIEHETISKCTSEQLKTFVHVRRPDLPKSKLPKKGNVSDAIKGADNLIELVYECRSYPNILKQRLEKEILGDKLEEQEEDSSPKFTLFHG